MRSRTKLIAVAALMAATAAGQPASAQSLPLANKGQVNPNSWIYGPRNDDASGGVIWNPVKAEMLAGGDVIGRTVSSNNLETMMTTYCTAASQPTADFTWTEMQHSGIDWG